MNEAALKDWLTDAINVAERDADESHKIAHNSYGAGYDRGYVNALNRVFNQITGTLNERRSG